MFEPAPEREYAAVVTNREGPGDELIHWHRGKCGTVERAHDWLKNDVGARRFPSSRFGANAAWYRLAALALNLCQAMRRIAFPGRPRGERLRTFRFWFLNRAGRAIRRAGRYVALFSRLASEALRAALHARGALAQLTPL